MKCSIFGASFRSGTIRTIADKQREIDEDQHEGNDGESEHNLPASEMLGKAIGEEGCEDLAAVTGTGGPCSL